jgi:hypothetical protein
MLLLGRRHLERVLRAYAAHYNERRPHRGLELRTLEHHAPSAAHMASNADASP